MIHGSVILRTGRRIPSVLPLAGVHAPISVVRMATEGAYAAEEWRDGEGLDEIAYSKRHISRRTCRAVAEFTFRYAQSHHASVFGGPKYTVSPVYEGMFKESWIARRANTAAYVTTRALIDATYALLLETHGEALVIPALNRDGDSLSDLVIKMFGTIAGAESVIIAFDDEFNVKAAITEAPHGTAPTLQGKNIANPMAMILACAALLKYIDGKEAALASRALYEATLESVYNGIKTPDLGGTSQHQRIHRRGPSARRAASWMSGMRSASEPRARPQLAGPVERAIDIVISIDILNIEPGGIDRYGGHKQVGIASRQRVPVIGASGTGVVCRQRRHCVLIE